MIVILLILMGVCSPFDWTDCGYTLEWLPTSEMGSDKGYWNGEHGIYFNQETWMTGDCFGMTNWKHEWYHTIYGEWHDRNCVILKDVPL